MAPAPGGRWRGATPAGYVRFAVGRADVVARADAARAVKEAMSDGTLYRYAARHPRARSFAGRSVVWAAPLPDGRTHVVVRHSEHGGLLARLTGDRFLAPTRAPHELAAALRLAEAGVPTPEVVAYATYPAGAIFRRADVATREIVRGKDLAWIFLHPPEEPARARLLGAVRRLLAQLLAAGATHPDLNLKNVLLAPVEAEDPVAHVLDVDRVVFGRPHDRAVWDANLARLRRSARKWRARLGALMDESALAFEMPRRGEYAAE